MPQNQIGPRQDIVKDGRTYRYVPSKNQYYLNELSQHGRKYKLFGDKYFLVPQEKPTPQSGVIGRTFNQAANVENRVPPEKQITTSGGAFRGILKKARPTLTGIGTGLGAAVAAAAVPEFAIPAALVFGVMGGAGTDMGIRAITGEFGKESPPSIGEYLAGRRDPTGVYPSLEAGAMNEVGGEVFNKIFSKLPIRTGMTRLLENIAGRERNYNRAAIERYSPNIPMTTSMTTGSKAIRTSENLFSPGRAAEVQIHTNEAMHQEALRMVEDIIPELKGKRSNILDIYDRVKGNLSRFLKVGAEFSTSLAEKTKNIAKFNQVAIDTPTGPMGIKGPINLTRSMDFLLKFINEHSPASTAAPLGNVAMVNETDAKIFRLAKQAMQGMTKDVSGKAVSPMASFNKVWELKKVVGEKAFVSNEGIVSGEESSFRKLYSNLGKDIETSMANWRVGGKEALSNYQASNAIVTRRYELMKTGSVLSRFQADDGVDTSRFAAIFKDRTKLANAIQTGNKKEMQVWKIQNILNKAYDSESKTYNPKTLINGLEDPETQGLMDMLFKGDEKVRLERFFNVLSRNSGRISKAGQIALAIRGGSKMVELATAGVTGAMFAAPSTSMVGAGIVVGLIFGMHKFTRNVLLNPAFAAYAIKAAGAPATSQAGKVAVRALIGTMQNTKVLLRLKDGTVREGMITKDNKIKELSPGIKQTTK